jgi:uncharacterized protein (TIGR03000 family)
MLKRQLWATAVVAVVAAGLLLTPGISQAQRGGGGGGRGGGGGGGRGGGGAGMAHTGGGARGGSIHGGNVHNGNFHNGNFHHGHGTFVGVGLGWWPWYGGYGGYGGYGYYDGYYGGDTYNYYYGAGVTPAAYPSYYALPEVGFGTGYAQAPPLSDPNAAGFVVRVPDPNAEVWFQDYKTQQQGAVRAYESAALDPNRTYTFKLRARWTQNGRPVEQTRDVQARAGEHVSVVFRAPAREQIPAPPASGEEPKKPESP